MNLHDIKEPITPPRRIGVMEQYWRDNWHALDLAPHQWQYVRQTDPLLAGRLDEVGWRPAFDTVPFRTRTRDRATEVGHILGRLDAQFVRLARLGVTVRDLPEMAFILDDWEWHLVRLELPLNEMARQGFGIVEGTEPTYRGFPLRIVRGYRA
jgi:hypothetical protein